MLVPSKDSMKQVTKILESDLSKKKQVEEVKNGMLG